MRRSEVGRVEVLCGERGQRRHMHGSQVDMTGICEQYGKEIMES
jgi:hypothetical protein